METRDTIYRSFRIDFARSAETLTTEVPGDLLEINPVVHASLSITPMMNDYSSLETSNSWDRERPGLIGKTFSGWINLRVSLVSLVSLVPRQSRIEKLAGTMHLGERIRSSPFASAVPRNLRSSESSDSPPFLIQTDPVSALLRCGSTAKIRLDTQECVFSPVSFRRFKSCTLAGQAYRSSSRVTRFHTSHQVVSYEIRSSYTR